jgi:transposase
VSHTKRRYTSDLTDEQWEILKPRLPLKQDGPGRPLELDMRQVVNAIFYINRTGCQWANLPKDYPNYIDHKLSLSANVKPQLRYNRLYE